jgi:hypothetical protein
MNDRSIQEFVLDPVPGWKHPTRAAERGKVSADKEKHGKSSYPSADFSVTKSFLFSLAKFFA